MKLHLPKALRGALLACFASFAGLSTTLATGVLVGGAFSLSLAQVAQAEAVTISSDTTWSNSDAANHAADTVTVDGGNTAITLQIGNGGTNALSANSTIDFGDVTVNSGDTLKLWSWTTTQKNLGETGKVKVNSAITLTDSTLYIEDGSYYFAEAITLSGNTTIQSKWAKGITLHSLTGSGELTLVHGIGVTTQGDQSRAVFELDGDNTEFTGTVKLQDNNLQSTGSQENGIQLVLSNANALVNAILDLGNTEDVTLSLNAAKVVLKAIKGHGFVEYYNSSETVGELQITNATGDFSGTSAANVNWNITGGNQGLNNATILGSYTVGTGASSTFTGDITLGSLSNSGSIDVSNLSSLTITEVTPRRGATVSVGSVTGTSSSNSFTYGNGWTATVQDGVATLSDGSIWWQDTADDTESGWNTASNWENSAVPSGSDVNVRLVADESVSKNIEVDTDINVGKIRVDAAYTLNVAEDTNHTLTTTGITYAAGASLAKTGAGTLSMSAEQATSNKLHIEAGALKLTDRLSGDNETNDDAGAITYEADFSLLTVGSNGTLSITAAEKTSNNRTTVKLGESFDGTLEITGGYVDTDSAFDQATIKVNGGGLLSRVPAGDISNKIIIGDDGATFYSLGSTGVDSTWKTKFTGTMTGSANAVLTIQERGDWYFAGDMSGFSGSIVLNNSYDRVFFQSSARVKSFSASFRLDGNAQITFGDGTASTSFVVQDAMTVGAATTFEIKQNAAFKNEGQVQVSDSTTFVLKGDGQYEMASGLVLGSSSKLDVQGSVTLNLGNITQTATVGEIAIATGATVNDSRALTIDGTYTLSGEGTYKQLGSLTIKENSTFTLAGKVSLSDQLDNKGTLDVSNVSALALTGFGVDSPYTIGTVANVDNVNWASLLGYTASNYSVTYENGVLSLSDAGVISWISPADGDITWSGANWKTANGDTPISIGSADSVVLDVIDTSVANPVSSTIEITADTSVVGLTVNDAYKLSVSSAENTYSFAADSYTFGENGSLSKSGAGTLSMSLSQAIAAKMNVTEGTLKLTDTLASNPLNNIAAQDLTAISSTSSGVLRITAGGAAATPGASNQNNWGGPTVSAILLDDSFTGTLEVQSGKLSVTKSSLGGTSLIHLNGGGLLVSTSGDSGFASQEFAYNLYAGVNGGYLDHYGASGDKADAWSSKHTGTMSGSGVVTLIGYGEWMFAGNYTNFTGAIAFGQQANRVYISSDMTGLSALVNSASEVAIGYMSTDNRAVNVAVSAKETLSGDRTILFANNSTFTHTGGVEVAAGKIFKLNQFASGHTGVYNAANVALNGSEDSIAKFEVGTGLTANITDTASYTATAGEIAIATGATVNDSRALTIDGAYTLSGAGAYNQQGSLALTANGVLTLSGQVSIASLAGNNEGTITFADTLTRLTLQDFTLGQDYEIGTVTNGADVAWGSLLGYDNSSSYSFAYDATTGILSSASYGAIFWASPADDGDITWSGANWKTEKGTDYITLKQTGEVVELGEIDATVSSTIEFTANAEADGVTVSDAYTFSVTDESASYTLTAPISIQDGGALTKDGAGNLTLTSDLVVNELTVNAGTLTTGDVTPATGSTFTQSGSGTLAVAGLRANTVSVEGTMTAVSATPADGTTFTKTGEGALTVGTLTANEANVTGNMSATTVNMSDGNDFTKSGEGALEIGTLNANSATVSAGSLSVDTATLKSGNTFTKSGANTLNLGTTSATTLSVSEGDLIMTKWAVAEGTTVSKNGSGTLTIAGDTSALKGNLNVGDGNVTFAANASFGSLAIADKKRVNIGTEDAPVHVSFTSSSFNGVSGNVSVAAGSTLTAQSVSINNSTYRLYGGGVYNIGQVSLATSNTGNMEIHSGLTVNVTGTTTTNTTDGSFVLGRSSSTINVWGTLSLASGISATGNGTHTINVGPSLNNQAMTGATLWLKDGLWASVATDASITKVAIINVKNGNNLVVDGANTDNAALFTVNLEDGATVFTTAGGTILNGMDYNGTVKLGAAANTRLQLTYAEQNNINNLTILGAADAVNGTAAGGTVEFTGKISGASVSLNAGAGLAALGGLDLTGALTLGADSLATLAGAVSLGSLSNAGSIDITDLTSLAIGDIEYVNGKTYKVGTLTGYENKNWDTLLGVNDLLNVSYDADTGYLSVATDMTAPVLWMGAEGATWDSTAADGTDTASWKQNGTAYVITNDSVVVLGNAAKLGDESDAVSRTIVLDADTVVNSVTVQDTYHFSVAEGGSYSFDAGSIELAEGGSLSKTGAGTLRMSLEDAEAAKMAIDAGVLQISDTLADTSAGSNVDLSFVSGSGTLAIAPAGTNGGTSDGTRTAVTLGDEFTGTLQVTGGQLDAASAVGGASLVLLDGATLTATGGALTEVAWNIAVSDNDAHLRRFGNTGSDERTSYATRLTGTLSGGTGAVLNVIDSGEWFFAGDMSGYTGGLNVAGNTNYVTFEKDATLSALTLNAGGHLLATDNATVQVGTAGTDGTFTAGATSINGSGMVYVGADTGATLNLGNITLANGSTLHLSGGGTHTANKLVLSGGTGAVGVTLGDNTTLTIADTSHLQTTGPNAENPLITIQLGDGAKLVDAATRRIAGGTLSITGSGVYELAALQLSNGEYNSSYQDTKVTIGSGATLHITGTTTTNGYTGDGGSLLTGTQNKANTITVNGTLALECGVSRYMLDDTANTIDVESGGKIAFNKGLTAANENGEDSANLVKDIINIKGNAVLEVSGETATGANLVTVNVYQNGIVMGGDANGATASTIVTNLNFVGTGGTGEGGAYIGAKAGTTLTLAPASGTMSIKWMDIMGTADAQGMAQGAGGTVVFAKAVSATQTVKVLSGATAEFQQGLTVSGGEGLANYGTLTLKGANLNVFTNATDCTATFQGAITIGTLAGKNDGTINVADATSLTLGDFALTDGNSYLIGALAGWDNATIGSLLGAGAGHTVTYDGTSTLSVVSHLVWDAQAATEGDNIWNSDSTNENWMFDGADCAFKGDKLVVFAENTDAVSDTVVLGADMTAQSLRVLGAYKLSVAADATRTLDVTDTVEFGTNGSLSKTGEGVLVMSNADALAAKMHIAEGALQLSDSQANTMNSGTILEGATNTDTWRESGLVVDLSGLSAAETGTLQLTLAGTVDTGNDSTRLQLGDDFHGKVEVLGGQLGHASNLGGAAQVILNGGGIVFNNDADDSNNSDTTFATPVHIAGTGALRAWSSYTTAAVLSTLTGDAASTLHKYDGGAIRINELSGFAGAVEIHDGTLILADETDAATITKLSMAAGKRLVLESGQQLTVGELVNGATIDLNGASSLTISAVNADGSLDLEGDALATAEFGVAAGRTFTLAHDGLTLASLTNAGEGTLKLKGAVTLGDLVNEKGGTIDLTEVNALSISRIEYAIGSVYHVGSISGKSDTELLALIGNGGHSYLTSTYDATSGYIIFDAATYWADTDADTDTDHLWSSADNWSTGSEVDFSLAGNTVKLGAEAKETRRTIVLDTDIAATTTVHVAANGYSLELAEDTSYAFNGTLEYAGENVQALTKTGAGSLTVSMDQATAQGGMHIAEGTLVVRGDQTTNSTDGKTVVGGFSHTVTSDTPLYYDLSAVSATESGILSVALYGNPASTDAYDATALHLADDFYGTLKVTHGNLMWHQDDSRYTDLGGAKGIMLDGGGLALYDNDTVSVAMTIGTNGGYLIGAKTGNVYSGAVTGDGSLTLIANGGNELTVSGSIVLGSDAAVANLVKRGGGAVTITGEDNNNITLSGGVTSQGGTLTFQNAQKLNSLTITGGTTTLEKDATLGSLSMNTANLIIGTAGTEDAAGAAATVTITSPAARTGSNGSTRNVTLNSGSVVDDAAYWQLTGGTLTLNGEGTYNIAGMGLSANLNNATTVNIESGVKLHVTGTTNDAGKNTGSFSMAHWNSQNTVNVRGELELESGISTFSSYATTSAINVENGGRLAFNNGLTAVGVDNAVTINISGGATLEVSGTNTEGTNLVKVNVAQDGIVMGGDAKVDETGAIASTIANNMTFSNGAYFGAKQGTTLTIAPEDGLTSLNWLDILGTDAGAGGTVVFASNLEANATINVLAGAAAEVQGNLTVGNVYDLNNSGTLTLSGDVIIEDAKIANSGVLNFDGADTITLGAAIANSGTVNFADVGSMQIVLDALEIAGSYGGAMRQWQIVDNNAEGATLTGWQKQVTDEDGTVTTAGLTLANFTLNGEELKLGSDSEWDGYELDAENGTLTLYQSYRYWDSVEGEDPIIWDTNNGKVWRDRTTMEGLVYEANSRVAFGQHEDADDINQAEGTKLLNKNVTVADEGVLAKNLDVFGDNYVFSGGKITVTKALSIQKDATFSNTLVIGDAENALQIDVDAGKTMTLAKLETLSTVKDGLSQYNAAGGSFRKTGEGTLSITDTVAGIIHSAAVEGGTLTLADTASLTVGTNKITGGSLQNVVLNAADTSIRAFDAAGADNAVLTGVQLTAGSATAYATVEDVTFAGDSTLTGYITFAQTQSAQDMQVAAGGTLTVSNLTLDLHGLAAGEKQIILNSAITGHESLGSISGWNAENVNLVYSGVAVNSGSVDLSTDGVVKIASQGAALYWDGLEGEAAAGDWNTTATNWSTTAGSKEDSLFYALSDTYFAATPDGAAKTIDLKQDVVMTNLYITEGGYTIGGNYRMASLGNVAISHTSGTVSLGTAQLVVQGSLSNGDSATTMGGELVLNGATTVVGDVTLNNSAITIGADLSSATGSISLTGDSVTVNDDVSAAAGNISISSGSTAAGGAGSFTLGSSAGLSAAQISIDVDAGADSDTNYKETFVTAAGSISASDKLTISGSAAKSFTGAITANTVSVEQSDAANKVQFDMVTAQEMNISESSTAYLLNVGASIGQINLAGEVGFQDFAGVYNGLRIQSESDSATASFATITTVTLAKLSGAKLTDEAGNKIYGSMTFQENYRNLTINELSTIQDLTIGKGEYGATLNNAVGAIYGDLTLLGGKLTVNSANIMANGTGAWNIDGNMLLGNHTQTLAGNTINLSNGAINGNATHAETQTVTTTDQDGESTTTEVQVQVRNEGLSFTADSKLKYTGSNTISANVTVAAGKTLSVLAAKNPDDTLVLSGSLGGEGALSLSGDGTVSLSYANTDYTGTVTVQGQSTLQLNNTQALSAATLQLVADGTLYADAGALGAPAQLGALVLQGGLLQVHELAATDSFSAADAALRVGALSGDDSGNLTLDILLSFDEGNALQNMMTYNLISADASYSLAELYEKLTLNLSTVANDASSLLVPSNQYKLVYDATENVISLRTMLGNIWSGGALLDGERYTGDGIWSTTNEDINWSGSDYKDGTDTIFVDLADHKDATVTIGDKVSPGDVYFEADTTDYTIITSSGAGLAAGTNIHKAGAAYVYLNLTNNATMDNALGNIDLQNGKLILESDLAVNGDVIIGAGDVAVGTGAILEAYHAKLIKENYTAQGRFSNLTMTDDAIRGESAENKGIVRSRHLAGTDVAIAAVEGKTVLLENIELASAIRDDLNDSLTNVTIGENVEVTGNYTLNGAMVFNHTLANSGTVTLATDMTAEIGKLGYTFTVDAEDASWYTYQLVQDGTINGMADLAVTDVTIGGVNLGNGLAEGVATYITNGDGSITFSIGNVTERDEAGNVTAVDGTIGIPQWDERWEKSATQPALSRRYAGTEADATLSFAEKVQDDKGYYHYSTIVSNVSDDNDMVVATLSSVATGSRASGGSSEATAGKEMWIYDRSGFDNVIGGQYADAAQASYTQTGDTHVMVNTDARWTATKALVVGGSYNVEQTADSYVTVQGASNIALLLGGSYGAAQTGTAHVYIDGGRLYEVFAAGWQSNLTAPEGALAVDMLITGGELGGTYNEGSKKVYGGSYEGMVTGDIHVTVDGTATITTLYGGNYGGTVNGCITLDLISGTVTDDIRVAGVGYTTVNKTVQANLYAGFTLANIYGGKESGSQVTFGEGVQSILKFAEAGATYDLTGKKVQGFSDFTLEDDVWVKLSTDSGSLTDAASGLLTISGAGMAELTGSGDLARDIILEDGVTLWLNSDEVGNAISTENSRRTLTATAGTTIELEGRPAGGNGLSVWIELAGHGVDGKGALHKTLGTATTNPSGKVALPRVTLNDSASVGAEDNIYVIEYYNNESELFLQGNTLTKLGANSLVFYNTTVEYTTDTHQTVDGTIYVREGTLGTGYGMRAAKTNVVLGAGSTLDVTNTGTDATVVGALSGSGGVKLANQLTLTTNAAGSYDTASDWMTPGADTYGQFSADTGFVYGVYSGTISGSAVLEVTGDGTQYLSGNDSSFSGGTHLTGSAQLYLLGSTEGTMVAAGNTTVSSGVLGTGAIAWDSAAATLYLGHGVHVYNNGTTNAADANMIIGVEAAPNEDALTNYAGKHGTITLNGVQYAEVDTHNLYSISCNGLYADGSEYVAGTAIDRDKMLLVTKEIWDADEADAATVTGFSGGGYNEATYSGVLGGKANLKKVGLGTLVLDQQNTYTGSTIIAEGTLALKGWAQIGSSASGALNVEQTEGSSLMLAYDGTYTGEITAIANNMSLAGTGDVRWNAETRTGNATAALISDIGGNVTFTLSGNLSGEGNLLHSGEGRLVLNGDSTFSGGTHATSGVVEVQSAAGMGSGKVQFEQTADLDVTVEAGTTGARLTTTIAADDSFVKGDVSITGTAATERVLSVNTAGYTAEDTVVQSRGTLLVNGSAVQATTQTLSGDGTLAVSDATKQGATATVNSLTTFTGDFVVEGSKAAIEVGNGDFSGGSISVSGQDAKVDSAGKVNIAYGEKLMLKSTGNAASTENTAAVLSADGGVNIATGGTLSVSNAATGYQYNLAGLQKAAETGVASTLATFEATEVVQETMGTATLPEEEYNYHFDADRALNAQAAGMVEGGLTLNSDSRYEETCANISLAGGSLTLDTTDGKIALNLLTDANVRTYDDDFTSQIVLFSGVTSLTLDGTAYGQANAAMLLAAADGENAAASNTVYSTLASNYLTGWNITDETYLVYDAGAQVVYLDKAMPEPTTTTLSILALAALAARRRRK